MADHSRASGRGNREGGGQESDAAPRITRTTDALVVDNGEIRLSVDRRTGRFGFAFPDGTALENLDGEIRVDGSMRSTDAAPRHEIETKTVKDAFGSGVRVTLRHLTPHEPETRHVFWIYQGRPEAIVRLELVDGKGTNGLAPLVTAAPVKLPHQAELRALFVPWDNDNYFRYRSDGWGEGEGDGDGSYEVGAMWDDSTRHGLVVGSIDHDLWKTAVRFHRSDGLKGGGMQAFAGVTSKYTHDSQPHGTVTGRVVASPRMMVGRYDDWRDGMERYGDLNALVKPPLLWDGPKPFFWNSWSGHKTKVKAEDARYATDFIAKELPGFRSGGTAYVNFDAGAGNLSPAQMDAFVAHAHSLGLRTGIYWTPFAGWSELDRPAGVDKFTVRDLVLKDAKGQPLPKLDGAYPLDPTHPGTLKRIDDQIRKFVAQGFDYVKLDFLSHGALEGVHYDKKVPTGTAAYALGMKRIADDLSPKRIGRPFFISLSIAPLFPQGYAHSRRISCDIFANIGASEYLMNSANYAWWEGGRLYRFDDPDSATVFQAEGEASTTEAEARTRFVASVVAGGMMILGDDLGKPEARARVHALFGNAEALEIARSHSPFRPVDGDTGYAAGETFVRGDGKNAYVAVFNYDKTAAKRRAIPLARLGLAAGAWTVHDVFTGAERRIDGDLKFDLAPMSCALVRLSP